ncbi:MAG: hypothetical protein QM642_08030 [Edaphocola sp.]
MKHHDEFLERIRKAEMELRGKKGTVFSNCHIRTTKEVSGNTQFDFRDNAKIFKRDIFLPAYCILFSILCIWVLIKGAATEGIASADKPSTWLVILALAVLLVAVTRQTFFDKKRNFPIALYHEKIVLNNATFCWEDVYETAILSIPGGKTSSQFLVIALKNDARYVVAELSSWYC